MALDILIVLTTNAISATSLPAYSATKAMAAARRETAPRRSPRSTSAAGASSCSMCGSMEARWTGWKCSTMRSASRNYRSSSSPAAATSTAVSAIARGAMDFLEKPFEAERLLLLVERATATDACAAKRPSAPRRIRCRTLRGNSSAINQVRATLKRVAEYRQPPAHYGPGRFRARKLLPGCSIPGARVPITPFVTVNSARITERFEQELFGEEVDGKLVRAGFLEWPMAAPCSLTRSRKCPPPQARILVLTEQSFVRGGGTARSAWMLGGVVQFHVPRKGDRRTSLRENLFYRLNVAAVAIPSLIERREDIPALADNFFARYANEQVQPPTLSPEAIAAMQSYDWPGNVPQLRNVVERTIILAPRERSPFRIDADMLPSEIVSTRLGADTSTSALMGVPLREARENFEREYLKVQIRGFGQYLQTASFIGMGALGAARKLKLLGMAERRGARTSIELT